MADRDGGARAAARERRPGRGPAAPARCTRPRVAGLLGMACAAAVGWGAPARAVPHEPDLSTPRRALRVFIDAGRRGDFAGAARALDLGDVPDGLRVEEGARAARQLKAVLDRKLWIDWDAISDAPEGNPADGASADVVGAIAIDGASVAVRLTRAADGRWRVGRGVVDAVPRLYAEYGPGPIGERMPRILVDTEVGDVQAWQWIGLAASLLVAAFAAVALGALGKRLAARAASRTRTGWDDRFVNAAAAPTRGLLGIAAFTASVPALRLSVPAAQAVNHSIRIASLAVLSWAALRAVRFAGEVIDERLARAGDADGAIRARRTQLMVLRRVGSFVVVVIAGALVLVQFDGLRAVGASLLASAGVAGLVVGLAAQRSIATVLAGLQLSLTQPLRVGDVVVIEGEWGTIEEITLTHVVVKIWDLRRLVVPITRILETPFQNWTRSGSEILGTVFVHADYRVPVELVRLELRRFVASRPEWDGKVVGIQVTNATERSVELRALVSSADAGRSWDLRCAVREHLIGFIQQLDGGRFLPRSRIDAPQGATARNTLAAHASADLPGAPG